jgi:hypothetical protein
LLLAEVLHYSLSDDLLIPLLLGLGGDIHAHRCDELQLESTPTLLFGALGGGGKCLVVLHVDIISRANSIQGRVLEEQQFLLKISRW